MTASWAFSQRYLSATGIQIFDFVLCGSSAYAALVGTVDGGVGSSIDAITESTATATATAAAAAATTTVSVSALSLACAVGAMHVIVTQLLRWQAVPSYVSVILCACTNLRVVPSLLSALSAVLSVFFWQPQLPPPTGPYAHSLGYSDVCVVPPSSSSSSSPSSSSTPSSSSSTTTSKSGGEGGRFEFGVSARVLYPAAAVSSLPTFAGTVWPLRASSSGGGGGGGTTAGKPAYVSARETRALIALGARDIFGRFANALSFLLQHWALIPYPAKLGAAPAQPRAESFPRWQHGFPVVVFSHGLYGTVAMYSTLALELASHGFVVIAVQHNDGSGSWALGANGREVPHRRPPKGAEEGHAYVHFRRDQSEIRASEVAVVLDALPTLAAEGAPQYALPSLSGTMDYGRVLLAGHSFGGNTALTVAARYPQGGEGDGKGGGCDSSASLAGVLVYDPAVDWMPDDARHAFLPKLQHFAPPAPPASTNVSAAGLEDLPVYSLYSESWFELGWGGVREAAEAIATGRFGRGSAHGVVESAGHQDAADHFVLLPPRLLTALNLVQGSAVETLGTIASRFVSSAKGMVAN